MKHFATSHFWTCYERLPDEIRQLADKNFKLLKSNPRHPSLHFKKIGDYRSARVGLSYRALATEVEGDLLWFWIGTHAEYDEIVR
ncbi:MAG: hypothetical protein HY288_17770 [Planctomycetia bacterium]|nr:hypothetical protein [Planctomycetia bacterium]